MNRIIIPLITKNITIVAAHHNKPAKPRYVAIAAAVDVISIVLISIRIIK